MSPNKGLPGAVRNVESEIEPHLFDIFPVLPAEIRIKIWSDYLKMYEDNAPVAWKLIWGVDDCGPKGTSKSMATPKPDPKGKAKEKFMEEVGNRHLRIRPYIALDPDYVQTHLVEYHCCPLLKVNHEAREQALRGSRYASVPVIERDINVIVKRHDIFLPDEQSLFSLIRNWQKRNGPIVSITLAEDMSFAQRIIMNEDDVVYKMCRQGNYTLSAIPPHLHVLGQDRMLFSLSTIAQTYLRNAHTIFVECRMCIQLHTDGLPFSGTRFLPYCFGRDITSPIYQSIVPRLVRICQKVIADPSYRSNPAAWNLISQLHHTLGSPGPLRIREVRLGQFSYMDGVFDPDSGPTIYLVNSWRGPTTLYNPRGENQLEKTPYRLYLRQTFSRLVQPVRKSTSTPLRTFLSPKAPSPLPLRDRPQGRLLKVVAAGDGNFFREMHCYTPILPVRSICLSDRISKATVASPSNSISRGCPRCYRKQWLITGRKPDYIPFCRENTCWTSYYTYTGHDWDFFGVDDAKLQENEDVTDRGPQVINNTEDGYNSEDDERVVLHGRKEGLRQWWKSVDGYMEDEEVIGKIVNNEIEVEAGCDGLGQGVMKKGWVKRPRFSVEGGDGEEERLMFWDDLVEKVPGMSEEEILEMEKTIQEAT
ncbi:hypothetical protein B0T21DRAFT_427680 [Apiosordaria backusii]|uniref:2EXR domain-containing protein n=1 Tax=Apiosordaria backusii TaxID=314023 RepID=A0AA40DSL5_9PEZI|nr:hypothetical protein B0T21DRAFT_427680 [Apiosordaria backusii]